MNACGRADDAALVLRQRIEALASQLAELDVLKNRVLKAEQAKPERSQRVLIPDGSGQRQPSAG